MNSKTYKRIGEFILLEKLNSGGMGEVWLAKSVGAFNVSRFVAIKMTLNHLQGVKAAQLFMDEAKLAINLQHNNIVSVYDFKVEKGKFYLVMEYVHGTSLQQLLEKRKGTDQSRLPLPIIIFIIREIALGLDYAHHCTDRWSQKPLQLIHRDISPQNVLISYEGNVKIIDFGIAKSKDKIEQTGDGIIKGNCSYMSPEQASGQPLDLTSDLFSLGIILWELVANDRLFYAEDLYATLKNAREANVPDIRQFNPTVPAEIVRIIHKTLSVDRNARYRVGRDLAKDLTSFLSQEFASFTQNDFAIFMKSSFATEEKEISEKIKTYAEVINSGWKIAEEDDEAQNNEPAEITIELIEGISADEASNKAIDLKSLLVGQEAFSAQKKPVPSEQPKKTKVPIHVLLKRAADLLLKSVFIFIVIAIIYFVFFKIAMR